MMRLKSECPEHSSYSMRFDHIVEVTRGLENHTINCTDPLRAVGVIIYENESCISVMLNFPAPFAIDLVHSVPGVQLLFRRNLQFRRRHTTYYVW